MIHKDFDKDALYSKPLRLNPDTCGKEIELLKLRSAVIHIFLSAEHLMSTQEQRRKNWRKLMQCCFIDPGNKIMQCGTFPPDCKVVDRICMHMTWRLAVSAALK